LQNILKLNENNITTVNYATLSTSEDIDNSANTNEIADNLELYCDITSQIIWNENTVDNIAINTSDKLIINNKSSLVSDLESRSSRSDIINKNKNETALFYHETLTNECIGDDYLQVDLPQEPHPS